MVHGQGHRIYAKSIHPNYILYICWIKAYNIKFVFSLRIEIIYEIEYLPIFPGSKNDVSLFARFSSVIFGVHKYGLGNRKDFSMAPALSEQNFSLMSIHDTTIFGAYIKTIFLTLTVFKSLYWRVEFLVTKRRHWNLYRWAGKKQDWVPSMQRVLNAGINK